MQGIEIRRATAEDAPAIRRLAQLENRHGIDGPLLLAFVDGQPVAAITTDGLDAVADPFRPTAHIVEAMRNLLREVAHASAEETAPRRTAPHQAASAPCVPSAWM